MNALDETPVDLAAVQADDALLDMLTGLVVVTDDDLARALYAWRRDVDLEPIGELVDADTALAAIRTGLPHSFVGRVADVFRRLLGGRR